MTGSGEGGSATVLTLGAVASVVLVLTAALVLSSTVRDVHRARSAADLAALAASGALAVGGAVDCDVGASVAMANGAVLTRCEPGPDGSVLVTAEVARRWPSGWGRLPPTATARARAGVLDELVAP